MAHLTAHEMALRGMDVMSFEKAREYGVSPDYRRSHTAPGRFSARRLPGGTIYDAQHKNVFDDALAAELTYSLSDIGEYAGRAIQALVYDEVNGYIYTMVRGSVSGVENTEISRYPLLPTGSKTATSVQNKDPDIGHQGLAVGPDGLLWSQGPNTEATYNSRYIISFNYNAGGSAQNKTFYRVMPNAFENTTPGMSYDKKYIVMFAREIETSGYNQNFRVRVFKRELLQNGGAGDYRNDHIAQFNIQRQGDGYPNAITSDGTFIYISMDEGLGPYNSTLRVYTFDGVLIQRNNLVNIGQELGSDRKAEGLEFVRLSPGQTRPRLSLGFAGPPVAPRRSFAYLF